MTTTPLQAAYFAIDAATTPDTWIVAAKCKGLIAGYDERWREKQQDIHLVSCEKTIRSSLWNIDTRRKSRTYTLAGKLDKIASRKYQLREDTVLYDHKTTSSDISCDSPYWEQLAIESQVSHYELMLWQNGSRVDQSIWDVVRKPGINPRKLTKKEIAEVRDNGLFFGQVVSDGERAKVAQQHSEGYRESAELYSLRLAYDTTTNSDRYFARRAIARIDNDIREYAGELWAITQDMREARRKQHNYRNSGSCMAFGRPCKFLGICSGSDQPDSDHWRRKKNVHAELPTIENGRDVITNSRVRCFQSCRRKHFYQYELGIERVTEDTPEAIFFGNVWHAAQDAWWTACNSEREDHGRRA
jgi:hypothetical protein